MARERYLVNAGEDTIHQNEIRPETPQEKRKNWWFYHKSTVIVCVIAGLIICSMVYSVVSKVGPDYTVALMTSYSMSENGKKQLERCIGAYAGDRNGDGQVEVRIANYVFSSSSVSSMDMVQQQQVEMTKLMADCSVNESMIFLHDESSFDSVKGNFGGFFQYNDGTPMPETAVDYEKAMRPWSDFTAFFDFVPEAAEGDTYTSEVLTELYERLRVSVRAAEDSSIERNAKDMEYYKDSLALYDRLEAGEPREASGAGGE